MQKGRETAEDESQDGSRCRRKRVRLDIQKVGFEDWYGKREMSGGRTYLPRPIPIKSKRNRATPDTQHRPDDWINRRTFQLRLRTASKAVSLAGTKV